MDDFKKSKDPGVILPFTVLRRVDCVLGGRGVESRFVTTFKDRTTALTEASLLLAVFFLGTNFVAVKYAVGGIPPLPFVALRFTLAGLLLLGLLRILSPKSWPGRRDLVSMVGVGVLGVGMNNVAFTLGVSMTTASETALIYAAVPIWGMTLGSLIGLERPTRAVISGSIFSLMASSTMTPPSTAVFATRQCRVRGPRPAPA